MIKCWHENPLKRPDFREIVDVSTALLEKMGGALPAPDGARSLVSGVLLFGFVAARGLGLGLGLMCLGRSKRQLNAGNQGPVGWGSG